MPSKSAAEYQRALSEIEGAELAEEFVEVSPMWGSLIVAPGPMARQWLKANSYDFIARRGPISAWLNRELGVLVSLESAFGNVVTVGFTEPGKMASNPGTITGYHIGDFIEFFEEDAKTVSKLIGIQKSRTGSAFGSLLIAGFPAHALSTYKPFFQAAGLTLVVKKGKPSFAKSKKAKNRRVVEPEDYMYAVKGMYDGKWVKLGHTLHGPRGLKEAKKIAKGLDDYNTPGIVEERSPMLVTVPYLVFSNKAAKALPEYAVNPADLRTNPAFSVKEEPMVHKELLAFLKLMQDAVRDRFAPKRIKVERVTHARGEIFEVFWRHHRIARIAPRGRTDKGVLTVQVDPDWREFPATMLKAQGIPGLLRTDDADEAAAYILVLLRIVVSVEER